MWYLTKLSVANITVFSHSTTNKCDVSQFIYFCKTLYMFLTGFPSIIRSSKLHIQRQVFVRPLLLPAASSLYVQFWAPDDGLKNRLKHVQRLTEINKLRNVASCWLYSANILTMHGLMNVKLWFSLLYRAYCFNSQLFHQHMHLWVTHYQC